MRWIDPELVVHQFSFLINFCCHHIYYSSHPWLISKLRNFKEMIYLFNTKQNHLGNMDVPYFFSVKKCGVIIPFKIFWSFVREEYTYYTPLWILEFNHFLPLLIACKKKRVKKTSLPVCISDDKLHILHSSYSKHYKQEEYRSIQILCLVHVVSCHRQWNKKMRQISWQKGGCCFTIQRTQNVKIMHSRLFQCRNVKRISWRRSNREYFCWSI